MITHYVPYFTEPRARFKIAVCGATIAMTAHSVEPTCATCAAWLVADDADTKQLAAKWNNEARAARVSTFNPLKESDQ